MDPAAALASLLNAGRFLDVLLSDPAGSVIREFVGHLVPGSEDTPPSSASPPPLPQPQPQPPPSATQQDGDDSSSRGDHLSAQERLAVGLAAFNAFLQANVTGPALEGAALRQVQRRFEQQHRRHRHPKQLRKACLRSLDVDGVSAYEHIPLVELFCLARWVLTSAGAAAGCGNGGAGAERVPLPGGVPPNWLALRVHVWHYKLLTQPNLGPASVFNKSASWCDVPTLQQVIEDGLHNLEQEVLGGGGGSGWDTPEKVRFLVEKANVCIMLGQDVKARAALRLAAELGGFVYALSGALGRRTRFQEKSTSQLVVLAKSGHGSGTETGQRNQAATPQALALNDDTLLEKVEFTKEKPGHGQEGGDEQEGKSELPAPLRDLEPDEQPQLSPLDQIILLAEATLKDAFSPSDTLTSEEVLPFAVRVISDRSANWQIYTHALLVRSRIEVHRSRTVERGVLQMQAVVDQVIVDTTQPVEDAPGLAPDGNAPTEQTIPAIQVTPEGGQPVNPPSKPTSFLPAPKPSESAPAHVRLEYIHALSSPPRWHLESELAYSWAGVGSLVSALEIFKRLRLWAEVALCFASNATNDDEDGRGSGGESKAKAVLRWRLFHKTGTAAGDQVGSVEDDEEVVDLDSLKESDFHGPERRPAPPNAPRLWCILGDIENVPAHYERAWEISKHRFARAQRSLGEYYLQQKDLERARDAYKKAVAVNRLNAELWNRLGDISLRLGAFSDAAEAYGRAIAASDNVVGGEDARTWSNLGSALYSLYVERVKELKKQEGEGKTGEGTAKVLEADSEHEEAVTSSATTPAQTNAEPSKRDPATLLSQSLAAYQRGANIAHDNWRIWDNVITLASRLRPPAVSDLLLALRNLVRIRHSEEALDIDVLRLLLNEAVLSRDKEGGGGGGGSGAYEPPRGSTERAVCDFLETAVVPLITARSELWQLVARERAWRRDYAGAIDAAEKAWRAAVGAGGSPAAAASGGSLSPAGAGMSGDGHKRINNWLEDKEAWQTVVERTDELVSALESYGEEVPEIGVRWKSKARSAVRSIMGKAKESWEGSEEWERLVGLLAGLT